MRYAVFLILLAGCGYLFVNHYWRKFRLLNRRFNYRITDIWAAMVGLSPSMILAAIVTQHKFSANELMTWIAAIAGLAMFQIAGLAAAAQPPRRSRSWGRRRGHRPRATPAAASIAPAFAPSRQNRGRFGCRPGRA